MPDKSTQPRLDITKVSPDLYKAMAGLQNYVEASGLDRKLLDLVKIRASQINGCAYLHRYAYQRCAQAWRKRRVDASAQVSQSRRPPGVGLYGPRCRLYSAYSGVPTCAALWQYSPSKRINVPNLAPQMRVAFSKIASKTDFKSPGEELMSLRISDAADSCSSASSRS